MTGQASLVAQLRAIFSENYSSVKKDMPRLIWLVLSLLVARTIFRLLLTILAVAGVAFWVINRQESKSLNSAEDLRRAVEARQIAEETNRMVDEAHEKALAAQRDAEIRKKESDIQSAVSTIAMSMVAYNVDNNVFTNNLDELFEYGFRPHPDLIYDLKLVMTDNGSQSFIVVVRHSEEGPRAFKYDLENGRGVEPLE